MSLKITIQNGSILVRRWLYVKERKRSLPTTIMSISRRKLPDKFSDDQIEKFNITGEECDIYVEYVTKHKLKVADVMKKYYARDAINSIKTIVGALSDTCAQEELSDEDVEILSDNSNELKKLVTAIKSKRKRKSKNAPQPHN